MGLDEDSPEVCGQRWLCSLLAQVLCDERAKAGVKPYVNVNGALRLAVEVAIGERDKPIAGLIGIACRDALRRSVQ
jgi:hypothetical protein